jgi:hypothetical protein
MSGARLWIIILTGRQTPLSRGRKRRTQGHSEEQFTLGMLKFVVEDRYAVVQQRDRSAFSVEFRRSLPRR